MDSNNIALYLFIFGILVLTCFCIVIHIVSAPAKEEVLTEIVTTTAIELPALGRSTFLDHAEGVIDAHEKRIETFEEGKTDTTDENVVRHSSSCAVTDRCSEGDGVHDIVLPEPDVPRSQEMQYPPPYSLPDDV